MLASIVIRTYNEARYLPNLLQAIDAQGFPADQREVIVVDSGSTDDTRQIAQQRNCRLVDIAKEDFSFGRSLNLGCAAARGDFLVFVSGHCVPQGPEWLKRLLLPFEDQQVAYTYGRQVGGPSSQFSEQRLFEKYFPAQGPASQPDFFCNNANAALRRSLWEAYPFDEELPGLEDMALAKQLLQAGKGGVAYVPEAVVGHFHHETWAQVKRRYERESIALQHIMPEIHLNFVDFLRYWLSAVFLDWGAALEQQRFFSQAVNIALFRFFQFYGSYQGNQRHRRIARDRKELYFYPSRGLVRSEKSDAVAEPLSAAHRDKGGAAHERTSKQNDSQSSSLAKDRSLASHERAQ